MEKHNYEVVGCVSTVIVQAQLMWKAECHWKYVKMIPISECEEMES